MIRTAAFPGNLKRCFPCDDLIICAAEHHEHRTVCFSVPYEWAEELAEDVLPLPLCTTDEACCRRCRRLIDEILLRHTTDPDGELYCAGLFLQLLAELAECSRQPSLLQADGSYRHVRKAKEYIFAHLHDPIRQQEIAAQLGITPEHLCQWIFTEFFNAMEIDLFLRLRQ